MGFTTRGVPSKPTTFTEREDVKEAVEEFAEEQGWDLSDVRNRAIMYYLNEYNKGNLDDPMIDRSKGRIDI